MNQAAAIAITTRRAFVTALATAPLAVAAPALAADNPDAEIIQIGQRHAALQALIAAGDDLPQNEFDALQEEQWALELAATTLPVTTVAGIAVLAQMARPWAMDALPWDDCHATVVARALFDKIEKLAVRVEGQSSHQEG